jgi:hypothetical protein
VLGRLIERSPMPRKVIHTRAARILRAKTLAVSDKVPAQLALVPKENLSVVVLMRDPRAVVRSDLERSARFKTAAASLGFTADRFRDASVWCEEHTSAHALVTFESLTRRPQQVMTGVATALGLTPPRIPSRLSSVPFHSIGGDRNAHRWGVVKHRERWRRTLPEVVRATAAGHEAMRIYRQLDTSSVLPLAEIGRADDG